MAEDLPAERGAGGWQPPPPRPRSGNDEERPTGVLPAIRLPNDGADARGGWLPEPPVRRGQPVASMAAGAAVPPLVGTPPPPPGAYPDMDRTAMALDAVRPGPPRKPRLVESFRGPRLRSRTGAWRRIRSGALLVVVVVVIALVVTGTLAAIVGGIAIGLRHASSG